MTTLLEKVKANLNVTFSNDDELIQIYITNATRYAEAYQHMDNGYYDDVSMSGTTEQAVIMLSSNYYESRDGSTGGFWGDNVAASERVTERVNDLLRMDREWKV